MDVDELVGLAEWMDEYVAPAMSVYEHLVAAMEHNASNGSKVPLREHLDSIRQAMLDMPVSQLSYQQADLLNYLLVEDLIGERGWLFIESTIKEGNYDPASAASEARRAKARLDSTLQQFKQIHQALGVVGLADEPEYEHADKVTIRVRFKDGVEISNVSQLKKWSAEWFDISRGLAMAANERPEDVVVKGATTGSIILVLGASLTVATMVALIMKQVASTVKLSMEIAHTLQDWKMRRIADAEIERSLQARRKAIEDSGTRDALHLVKEKLGAQIAGEAENALTKSIEKMFSFSAKGGEVDMLPPPEPSDDENREEPTVDAIRTITESVEEMRTLKAQTQLLIERAPNEAPGDDASQGNAAQ